MLFVELLRSSDMAKSRYLLMEKETCYKDLNLPFESHSKNPSQKILRHSTAVLRGRRQLIYLKFMVVDNVIIC